MTPYFPLIRYPALPRSLLGVALAVACSIASAQPVTEARASVAAQTGLAPAPAMLQIGDATHDLLALQRGGTVASPTPRPIAGDVASRSYQRYLKSFEHPIPQTYTATVKSPNSGAGSQ